MNLYRLLEIPSVYQLSQVLLAPGGERGLRRIYEPLLSGIPKHADVLDVGCGPSLRLSHRGFRVVGSDISFPYMLERSGSGEPGVVASATALPFADGVYDVVWNFGLLHHLPDDDAGGAVSEFRRVCRPGGRVIVFDAVHPPSAMRRPLAHLVRRLDRGRFVRTEAQLRRLLDRHGHWQHSRHTYTPTGLELLVSVGPIDANSA